MDPRAEHLEERILSAEHAAAWLHRLEKAGAAEKHVFLKWLMRSPDNSGEVLMATSTDLMLRHLLCKTRIDVERILADSANVLRVDGRCDAKPATWHRGRRWRLFTAVAVGVAAAVAVLFISVGDVAGWLHPNVYTTSVGEQRAVELPDGTAVAINARSCLRVAFSGHARDVYLYDGQAMFTVAKDASRPFRVYVVAPGRSPAGNGAVIQALGTKFDVQRRADRVEVAVIEGMVQILADSHERPTKAARTDIVEHARVAAGQAVSIENTGLITPPTPVNVSDVAAWQQRRLVFTDNTLEEIVEEFRRYNRKPHIHIEGEALRLQRFSGVFDADYPEALLLYLASERAIILEREGDHVTIRLRSNEPTQPTDVVPATSPLTL